MVLSPDVDHETPGPAHGDPAGRRSARPHGSRSVANIGSRGDHRRGCCLLHSVLQLTARVLGSGPGRTDPARAGIDRQPIRTGPPQPACVPRASVPVVAPCFLCEGCRAARFRWRADGPRLPGSSSGRRGVAVPLTRWGSPPGHRDRGGSAYHGPHGRMGRWAAIPGGSQSLPDVVGYIVEWSLLASA